LPGDRIEYKNDILYVIGAIPMDKVIGKAKLVYWPLDDIKLVE
jgi:signal peptidase I